MYYCYSFVTQFTWYSSCSVWVFLISYLIFINLHMVKFTLCGIWFYWFEQMLRTLYPLSQLWYRTVQPIQNILLCWPFAVSSSLCSNPEKPLIQLIVAHPIILPFLKCHRNGIIKYWNLCARLLLLSNMHRIPYVPTWINGLFLLFGRIPLYHVPHFVPPFTRRRLYWLFPVLSGYE